MKDGELQLQPGERFLDFVSLGLLGRGGVGEVYRIRYRNEIQALKIVRPQWVSDPGMCRRTLNEGQILTRIDHRNIVRVHDAGIAPDNRVWIRMELLDGVTLRELMRTTGRLSLPRMCALLRGAAHALHQCHLFGVYHRDVKPENFMVVGDGDGGEVIKLLDFGLAKLYGAETQDLAVIGTPQYMAPEQWDKRRAVGAATDLYALGLMGWEMFAGYHPLFPRSEALSPHQMMHEHFYGEVPSPEGEGMPEPIAKLVARACRKDPKRRPQDALKWAERLWGEYRKIRDADPEVDTYPGEPAKERILSRPMVVPGTGPLAGAPLSPVDSAPIKHAPTVRMAPPPKAPETWRERSPDAGQGRPLVVGRTMTVKLPDPMRDPSCVAAQQAAATSTAPIAGGRANDGGEGAPRPLGATGTVPIDVPRPSSAAWERATSLPFSLPVVRSVRGPRRGPERRGRGGGHGAVRRGAGRGHERRAADRPVAAPRSGGARPCRRRGGGGAGPCRRSGGRGADLQGRTARGVGTCGRRCWRWCAWRWWRRCSSGRGSGCSTGQRRARRRQRPRR